MTVMCSFVHYAMLTDGKTVWFDIDFWIHHKDHVSHTWRAFTFLWSDETGFFCGRTHNQESWQGKKCVNTKMMISIFYIIPSMSWNIFRRQTNVRKIAFVEVVNMVLWSAVSLMLMTKHSQSNLPMIRLQRLCSFDIQTLRRWFHFQFHTGICMCLRHQGLPILVYRNKKTISFRESSRIFTFTLLFLERFYCDQLRSCSRRFLRNKNRINFP